MRVSNEDCSPARIVTDDCEMLLLCWVRRGFRDCCGRGVRQRLAELRMPPYSPSFFVWLAIGAVYYAMSFLVLRHLLATTAFTPTVLIALALLVIILLLNALWNVLFFRWRDLRASF